MATATVSRAADGGRVLVGYLCALSAGALWGTTGPLSTALYAEGAALTAVGFWRILLATLGFALYGLARPGLFRVDRRGLLLVGLLGGFFVAVFEVAYQYAIAGVGVAGAATLLYTAPVLVAILAQPLLGERVTPARLALAVLVMVGVALTVTGHPAEAAQGGRSATPPVGSSAWWVGVGGGLAAAGSYAGTTLLARFAVPRYGSLRVLFLELAGGTLLLAALLPLTGHPPVPPATAAGWVYILALGLGSVVAANLFFFAGARRIEAAPTSVAASIEPVVGALLALALFGQRLTPAGWTGLFMVVAGVSGGYLREAAEARPREAALGPERA